MYAHDEHEVQVPKLEEIKGTVRKFIKRKARGMNVVWIEIVKDRFGITLNTRNNTAIRGNAKCIKY